MIRETFPPPPLPPTFWISDSAEDAIWFLETIHRPRQRRGGEKREGEEGMSKTRIGILPSFPRRSTSPEKRCGIRQRWHGDLNTCRSPRPTLGASPPASLPLPHPSHVSSPPPRSILPKAQNPGLSPRRAMIALSAALYIHRAGNSTTVKKGVF